MGKLFSKAAVGGLNFSLNLRKGEVLRISRFLLGLVFFDEKFVGLILCVVKVGKYILEFSFIGHIVINIAFGFHFVDIICEFIAGRGLFHICGMVQLLEYHGVNQFLLSFANALFLLNPKLFENPLIF